MFLLAHLGYTFLVAEIIAQIIYYYKYYTKKPELEVSESWASKHFTAIPLALGALGPDIIDKLISEPITGYGRYIGHSLIFAFGLFIMLFLIFRKQPQIYFSVMIGWVMHLLLDTAGLVPWFFPFVQYNFQPRSESFIYILLHSPYVYYNEMAGVLSMIFLFILYLRRGFTFKTMLQHMISFRIRYS